jgi:HSP20 family molecular chaperone IbpA
MQLNPCRIPATNTAPPHYGKFCVRSRTRPGPQEEKEEKGDYYRCEISQGSFTRIIALPAEVDESKATASMKDGMLELTLPKAEKSKRHTISIS